MLYVVNEPVSAINKGLTHWLSGFGTGNLVLLGIILGGMMAIDMGGPINKAAFTFGIAMIDAETMDHTQRLWRGGMVTTIRYGYCDNFVQKQIYSPRARNR